MRIYDDILGYPWISSRPTPGNGSDGKLSDASRRLGQRAARRDRLEDVVQHLLRDLCDLRADELRPLGHLRLVLGRRGLAQ